jgi:holliday junction DNA helicase RuvA
MISQITGRVQKKKQLSVIVDVNDISYEVMVSPSVMKSISRSQGPDGKITLITYHYYQMDQSKAIPVLVGFANEVEKDFFEQFITVSGVGPKAACRALSQPISIIADAIDRGDMAVLKSLPGIGEQKAREIIAKLQGKMSRFGLLRDRGPVDQPDSKEDVKEEAIRVLITLQYKKNEALEMVEAAVKHNPKVATCEEILNEVYKGSKSKR